MSDRIPDENYYNLSSFQEDKILIQDAVKNLDKELQEVIMLNFFEDLSQTQIAAKLGISQMQVSRKIKKALNALFEIIAEKKEQNNKAV